MARYISELKLSDKHYLAIGKIMAHWSMLEWSVRRAIAITLGLSPKEGRAITAELMIGSLLTMLRLVADLKPAVDPELHAELEPLLERIEKLIGERNTIAHALWARDDAGQIHILRYKGGKDSINRVVGQAVPMDDAEIEAIQAKITALSFDLDVWVENLRMERASFAAPTP